MNCTKTNCTGRLRITHTYTVKSSKHQRAECDQCGRVHTLSTVAEPTAARGDGAKARASRAAKGNSSCVTS